MVVLITNLTDAPGKDPHSLDIYNKTLSPGESIRLPAPLINEKIRGLEKQGYISIGGLPAWYTAAKRKKGTVLTEEEKKKRIASSPPTLKAVPKEPPKEDSVSSGVEQSAPVETINFRKRKG